jgi:CDGSH-type Zn-finger protein/truncated hemoglobin YjbI/ferredoxin
MIMEVALQELRQAAAAFEQDMPDEQPRQRLRRSVLRPLDQAMAQLTGSDGSSADPLPAPVGGAQAGALAADRALDLALQATRLRVEHGDGLPLEVVEAVAGLQDLAVALAPDDAGPRRATFAELQAPLPSTIHTEADGPYLVTNPDRLRSWLGVDMPTMPQMALCRCGQSASKPLCDGTHADIGFTDTKDPGRVPDRLDSYVGLQVTVHDNRGTCAHSGFCTDRVPTVFQREADAFVAPSGGRMDEIIRAVRACPSGALSLELTEHEDRELVDQDREPAIEVSRDGPYRITGGIPLLDAQRNPVARNAGASLEHYSLCRCGRSLSKPFCSGMHWYVEFQDPPLSDEPTLFEWAGGFTALRRMTHIFYETHVPEDPLLAPLFASMSPDHPERVAAWLGETFGGPALHTETYGGYDRMVSQHLGKALREEQRARWASLMIQSADEAGLPTDPEFRAAFVSYLEWGTRIAVENSTPGAKPPQHMPVPRWWWVCDATPGSRVSALAADRATGDEDQPPVQLPHPDEEPSFEAHIKPLFRTKDRQAMRFAFDLWSHQDVSQHADAILARLTAGSMPCDGAWPPEQIEVFQRWITAGEPP